MKLPVNLDDLPRQRTAESSSRQLLLSSRVE
jgi:hypothetical protein